MISVLRFAVISNCWFSDAQGVISDHALLIALSMVELLHDEVLHILCEAVSDFAMRTVGVSAIVLL